jgi:ubiquitin-like 1-activating enzyme E1 A
MDHSFTEEEAKLYDRQIRLWGIDAQKRFGEQNKCSKKPRMKGSNILLIGFRGLNSEICKNLVLAGVKSITILENAITSSSDLGSHIFLTSESVGKNVTTHYLR